MSDRTRTPTPNKLRHVPDAELHTSSNAVLARKYDVHIASITGLRRRRGIPAPGARRADAPPPKLPRPQVRALAHVSDADMAGASIPDLAARHGVAVHTVRRELHRRKMPVPVKGANLRGEGRPAKAAPEPVPLPAFVARVNPYLRPDAAEQQIIAAGDLPVKVRPGRYQRLPDELCFAVTTEELERRTEKRLREGPTARWEESLSREPRRRGQWGSDL